MNGILENLDLIPTSDGTAGKLDLNICFMRYCKVYKTLPQNPGNTRKNDR